MSNLIEVEFQKHEIMKSENEITGYAYDFSKRLQTAYWAFLLINISHFNKLLFSLQKKIPAMAFVYVFNL